MGKLLHSQFIAMAYNDRLVGATLIGNFFDDPLFF